MIKMVIDEDGNGGDDGNNDDDHDDDVVDVDDDHDDGVDVDIGIGELCNVYYDQVIYTITV